MAEVRYEGVYKLFGDVPAVEDLNLHVADGEFLVLVGPSGCGKTTSLRMLAGFERPTYGRIWIDDAVVNTVPPKARDIAMVFQSYALFPHMTVQQNLAFGTKVRREPRPEARARVAEVADLLGLAPLLDRKPAALSGGQRQRVALGRALMRRPKVFLMDEPLSNLDAALRVQMRTELLHLHKRFGATTVYVTHDQVEAMTMGDRIAVMSEGRLQQVDTPEALYDNPATLFVATFIGSPKMNVVQGRLTTDRDDGAVVECLDVRLPVDRTQLAVRRPRRRAPRHPSGGHRLEGDLRRQRRLRNRRGRPGRADGPRGVRPGARRRDAARDPVPAALRRPKPRPGRADARRQPDPPLRPDDRGMPAGSRVGGCRCGGAPARLRS